MEVVLNDHGLQVLNLLVAFIIPIIVAVITARYAASGLKSFVLIALAALAAIGAQILDDGSFVVFDTFILFVQNVLVAVVSHYGILKSLNVTGSEGTVARALSGGLGGAKQT